MDAILPQVDELLVFDNASADVQAVRDVLRGVSRCHPKKRITLMRSPDNLGIAAALNALALAAWREAYEYLLYLDQDSVAMSGLVVMELACMRARQAL